jgi:hypothetical protein
LAAEIEGSETNDDHHLQKPIFPRPRKEEPEEKEAGRNSDPDPG